MITINEKHDYGNWYHCSLRVLTKDNIKDIEDKMEESIKRGFIEQHELKALRYMLKQIKEA